MNQLRVSTSKQNRWVLAACPSTGEEVVGSGWQKELDFPDTEATWWHCPACNGWHVKNSSCGSNK